MAIRNNYTADQFRKIPDLAAMIPEIKASKFMTYSETLNGEWRGFIECRSGMMSLSVVGDTQDETDGYLSELLAGIRDVETVTIPALPEHDGYRSIKVSLLWVCPKCSGKRGSIYPTSSYDGSRRLVCDGWSNPCGHVDKYAAVLEEARNNGLNQKEGATNVE